MVSLVEEERLEEGDVAQKVSQKQISLATSKYYRHGTWYYASFHSTLIMIVAIGSFSGKLFQDVPSFQQPGLPEFLNFPRWFGVCIAILIGCILSYFAAELLIVSLEHDKQKFETFLKQPLNPKLNRVQKFCLCQFIVSGGLFYSISLFPLCGDILQSVAVLPQVRLFCLFYVLFQRIFCFFPDFHLLRFVSLAGILLAICYPLISIVKDIILSLTNKAVIDASYGVWGTVLGALNIGFPVSGLVDVCRLKQGRKKLAQCVVLLLLLLVAVILVIFVDDKISGWPTWQVTAAKTMVFLQIAAGCQIFSMVLFLTVEKGLFKQIIDQRAGVWRWIFRVVFTIFMVVACLYVPMFSVVIGSFGGHAGYLSTFILPFVIALKDFGNEISSSWKISYVVTIIFVTLFTIIATFVYFELFRSMQ